MSYNFHEEVPNEHQMQSNGYIVLNPCYSGNLIGNIQRKYVNGCKIYFRFLSFLKENGTTLMEENDDENNHEDCYNDDECFKEDLPFNKSTLNINIYKSIEEQLHNKLNGSFVIKINNSLDNNIQFVIEFIKKFEKYMTIDNSWCDMYEMEELEQLKYGNNDIYVAKFDPENG